MTNRDKPDDRDPDDWFDEPAPSPPRRPEAPRPAAGAKQTPEATRTSSATVEDWLSAELPGRGRRRGTVAHGFDGRAIAAAAVALVVLLIGLAAGGVFSGASRPRQTATTTRPVKTTPAPTTKPTFLPVRAPTTTLAPGDHGPAVKTLQQALARLGYSPGSIDGQYGPTTQTALARFQHASRLTADGILGPQTLAALTSALQGSG